DTEVITPKELQAREPEAKIEDVALAAYEPQSGYADPVATTLSLAEAARRAGAQFLLNTRVTGIETNSGRATGIRDSDGRLHEAQKICLVTGPWTDALLRPLGIEIGLRPERA